MVVKNINSKKNKKGYLEYKLDYIVIIRLYYLNYI